MNISSCTFLLLVYSFSNHLVSAELQSLNKIKMEYSATRINNSQPIITQAMFTDAGVSNEGENINGPTVLRIPDWIATKDRANPKANYYLYFAHHHGKYIRMAWSATIEGPWHLYQTGSDVPVGNRGVLDLGDSEIKLANGITIPNKHLASPDVHIDEENKQIILYFHSGSSTYVNDVKVGKQLTYVSTSLYGLNFKQNIQPVFLGPSYFRVFKHGGYFYAFTNKTIYRALDDNAPWQAPTGFDFTKSLWEKHPHNPFQDDINADGFTFMQLRVRHTSVRLVGNELHVFYSRRGDLLENIQMSVIDLTVGDWTKWDPSYPPTPVLQAKPGWEGGELRAKKSKKGAAAGNVNQLRDPFVFEDNDGSLYLIYTGRGEKALGLAKLTYKKKGE